MADTQLIEGRPTLVVETKPPLPQKLDGLLGSLQFVRYRDDIRPTGTAASCQLRDHRFALFREGRHVGLDGIVRDLRLLMCQDCGAVVVRDISVDRLEGLPTGGRGPARKDMVIGWYSGARRNGRTYT
jgi:hypothetical protein